MSLTLKTKKWCNYLPSRRFGKYSFHILECIYFFTRILRAYQNSGVFKFQILECISFFTRILGAYQNSGVFKFHILECISFFTWILGAYQNSGVFKFQMLDCLIRKTKLQKLISGSWGEKFCRPGQPRGERRCRAP